MFTNPKTKTKHKILTNNTLCFLFSKQYIIYLFTTKKKCYCCARNRAALLYHQENINADSNESGNEFLDMFMGFQLIAQTTC